MKNIVKSIATVALFLAATTLASATQPKLQFISDNSFILSINDLSSDLKISIKDKYGYKLYKKSVKAEDGKFLQKFSINAMPNGIYKLEIEDELKIVTLALNIENNKITSQEIVNQNTFKPVVYRKGENVYLSKFSPEKEPLKVVIYNSEYDVVYKETLMGKVDLGRVYSFPESGNYTIAVRSNNKTYEHTVSINK